MPTKPISPLTETAAAVPRVAAVPEPTSRTLSARTPRLVASSSPTARQAAITVRWSTGPYTKEVEDAARTVSPSQPTEVVEQTADDREEESDELTHE